MYKKNIVQTFKTSAEEGTSVYFVLENGTIRAKTADGKFHIRPGKNMFFIRDAKSDTLLNNRPIKVTIKGDGQVWIQYGKAGICDGRLVFDEEYNTPYDLYLDEAGNYKGSRHVGHSIGTIFKGGVAKHTESNINARIKAFVGPQGKLIKHGIKRGDSPIIVD